MTAFHAMRMNDLQRNSGVLLKNTKISRTRFSSYKKMFGGNARSVYSPYVGD